MLQDSQGRTFPYLRLSVIQKCNLRCQYCYDEEGAQCKESNLTLQEIENLAIAWEAMGCQKVRLTGGEPSLRKDITEIISIFSKYETIKRICMTTNGLLLAKKAEEWRQAGLQGLNISLDTLQESRFQEITQGGQLKQVLKGLEKAREVGFPFIKVNVVLWGKESLDELNSFIDFSQRTGIKVRYIELMETGNLNQQSIHQSKYIAANSIREILKKKDFIKMDSEELAGPQEIWEGESGATIGIIAPYDKYFCQTCNRLRVTSEGKLLLCLFGKQTVDVRPFLQDKKDTLLLQAQVKKMLLEKPLQHQLLEHNYGANHTLYTIGG